MMDRQGVTELKRVARVVAPVREQLLQMLRNAISSGELAPGERLIERDICERTGASRTSVREVLRQLEAEELVSVAPGRGTTVTVISADDAADIYELREVLEGIAAKRFAERATDAEIAELERALWNIKAAAARGDHLAALAAKEPFYNVLLGGSGNTAIRSTLKALQTRISMLRASTMAHATRLPESTREIEAIVEAIKARDGRSARRASSVHVRNAGQLAVLILRTASNSGSVPQSSPRSTASGGDRKRMSATAWSGTPAR
jgi:DNA-binding GntR family transcriptional regulator